MPQRRAMNRILPVLLAFLSAVAVILQGGAFPATAQVPVGTSTPQATGVASVIPSVTMTVTATPVATVSPTLSPTVAASPSVTVVSTATATASVAPVRTSTSVVSPGSPVRSRKVETASVSNVSFDTIAVGNIHTCGLTITHIAYCWGANGNGALGDGTTDSHHLPVEVSGGHTFSMIAAGSEHTCGVEADTFTAWCWGLGDYGQLGGGTTTNQPLPVEVSGGHTFSTISAGSYHTCGLTSAGAAWCWGRGTTGQLGDGSITDVPRPVEVSGGLTFSMIAAGAEHTCGVASGTFAAWCWGFKESGQLGDGTLLHAPRLVTG
ncbi:MAG: hypothetical protein NTV35_06575, partial [Chloroflexi bacterium]|nr:hypothetical protein [Chloroflexota bacterium]